jgi:hypothetical protein
MWTKRVASGSLGLRLDQSVTGTCKEQVLGTRTAFKTRSSRRTLEGSARAVHVHYRQRLPSLAGAAGAATGFVPPLYGPGVYSASNRNEYQTQKFFFGK